MKGDSARRVVVILLCVFAVVAACLGVSAGTGTDVEAANTTWSVMLPSTFVTFVPIWPNVTDVNPNGGLTTGGEEVVIIGTSLTGATEVTFGGTPATEPPTTAPPTTAAPTETTGMVTTTIGAVADGEGGGLSGGWIAFIAVIAVAAVSGMGVFVYRLGKGSK